MSLKPTNALKRIVAKAINDEMGRRGYADYPNVKVANLVSNTIADSDTTCFIENPEDISYNYVQKIAGALLKVNEVLRPEFSKQADDSKEYKKFSRADGRERAEYQAIQTVLDTAEKNAQYLGTDEAKITYQFLANNIEETPGSIRKFSSKVIKKAEEILPDEEEEDINLDMELDEEDELDQAAEDAADVIGEAVESTSAEDGTPAAPEQIPADESPVEEKTDEEEEDKEACNKSKLAEEVTKPAPNPPVPSGGMSPEDEKKAVGKDVKVEVVTDNKDIASKLDATSGASPSKPKVVPVTTPPNTVKEGDIHSIYDDMLSKLVNEVNIPAEPEVKQAEAPKTKALPIEQALRILQQSLINETKTTKK
jgi:hypothetical protein